MDTIAVLGSDGYTGWSLTCHLLDRGYDVIGVDDFSRRRRAGKSVTPITTHKRRSITAADHFEGGYRWYDDDITEYATIIDVLEREPDAIANLAQIPAAPFSMVGVRAAWETKHNNVRGTLNLLWGLHELEMTDTPVVQLATMGEYGTPDHPIPEGFIDCGCPAPKSPGSFYHASKVQMTVDTRFAARTWGIPVTEIYQGIVYGLPDVDDERLLTRFDVDATWGTVLNRFTAQAAVGEPLTVYGAGGQKRAMLSIDDCVRCLTLALENPPSPDAPGEYPYRAINQFDESHRVREVAEMVSAFTGAEIEHIDNPRVEDDSDHFYEPEREVLDELGFEPAVPIADVFRRTYSMVEEYTHRIDREQLRPDVYWTADGETAPADD